MNGLHRGLKAGRLLSALLLASVWGGCSLGGGAEQHAEGELGHHEEGHHEEEPDSFLTLDREAAQKAGIAVEACQLSEVAEVIETTAVVSANQSRLAHIRPLSQGTVSQVFVQMGQRVAQGQRLIEYDNIQMGELMGQLAALQARLEGSQALEERHLTLFERGQELYRAEAISARELEFRDAQYRSARKTSDSHRAEMARTAAMLKRLGASDEQMEQARKGGDLASLTTLRAPFSATVIEYKVAEGEVVSPDRPLLTLADLASVWVLADVYEQDLEAISSGKQVEVAARSYPSRSFKARVTSIGDVVDPQTRTVKVRCLADNPGHLLKLGMFVAVRIEKGEPRPVVTVPVSALQRVGQESVVFVQVDEDRFEKRLVRAGMEWQGRAVIDAGLQPGERVVVQGAFSLKSELTRETISGHEH